MLGSCTKYPVKGIKFSTSKILKIIKEFIFKLLVIKISIKYTVNFILNISIINHIINCKNGR